VFGQLTKVGGGAFGNDAQLIVHAIRKSLHKFETHPLDVYLLHMTPDEFYAQQLHEI
jgi:diketogulonate reductase-like aldo/keto reductase